MPDVCVVHLVWAPYGPALLERFLDSLRKHPAGVPYELLVVFNGFEGEVPVAFTSLLAGTEHRALVLPEAVQDLPAYRAALDATAARVVCFTNSHAEALVDGWLATLLTPLARADVGLAGATGSWESAFSSAPKELRFPRFRQFRRFPNPHLRTNAFAGRRELLLGLDWSGVDSKLGALKLESGRRGLAAQVRRRGLGLVVVGRDGTAWAPPDWERSATFRAGSQAQLLVADNRTRDYLAADPAERVRLARMAWGRRAKGD
ncbi:MAG: hypothetical protein JWO90_1469 [Solirubrobacterales bacterium]|jgi:hypothetical protein|nr:hypothetical protein [Solirubrobacterales bacterium]